MSIPTSLLQHVEQHGCFTGCYSNDWQGCLCLDPAQPLQPVVAVSCQDCFARIAVPQALLPAGMTGYTLADQLTTHLRQVRGFTLSKSGYHTNGPGFWLSVAYLGACGLFLVNGERSNKGPDLDMLLLAFQHKVMTPSHPLMTDPKQYTCQVVYVNFAAPIQPLRSKQDLLASKHCRLQATPGFQRVTLAEFLPVSSTLTQAVQTTAKALVPASASNSAAPRPLQRGDICPKCGAEVRERHLLQGTFLGCLC